MQHACSRQRLHHQGDPQGRAGEREPGTNHARTEQRLNPGGASPAAPQRQCLARCVSCSRVGCTKPPWAPPGAAGSCGTRPPGCQGFAARAAAQTWCRFGPGKQGLGGGDQRMWPRKASIKQAQQSLEPSESLHRRRPESTGHLGADGRASPRPPSSVGVPAVTDPGWGTSKDCATSTRMRGWACQLDCAAQLDASGQGAGSGRDVAGASGAGAKAGTTAGSNLSANAGTSPGRWSLSAA